MTGARPSRKPDRAAVIGSGAVHVGIVVLAWLVSALRPASVEYQTVMIQIISPPPAQAQEVAEESTVEEDLEIETPEPEPEETEIPLPTEEAPPPERPEEQAPVETTTPVEEAPTTTEEVVEPDEEAGEGLDIRLEGLRRDYPEYWNRIISQISRCFRGSQTRHSATVRFTVHRDGTVSDLDVVESSGSLAFEVSAIEAVECAGRGRLGPLPDDFQYETLPVLFTFEPRG